MIKVAMIGSSCAGKSTLVYSLIGRLKKQGILAEGVVSTDRKFSYPKSLLVESEDIQCNMIFNQLALETYWASRHDVEVLVLDRTPLDLWCYYEASFPQMSNKKEMVRDLVMRWFDQNYDHVFYLPPLPYQFDGDRPDENFRNKVADVITKNIGSFDAVTDLSGTMLENREDVILHYVESLLRKNKNKVALVR